MLRQAFQHIVALTYVNELVTKADAVNSGALILFAPPSLFS
jgi:hypothetical protein